MTDGNRADKQRRLDGGRCPDCNEELEHVMPAGAGMAERECPECGQSFTLATGDN